MGIVYLVTCPDYDRVKVGYWTAAVETLHSRYSTTLGLDCCITYFEHLEHRKIENEFLRHFVNYNITQEIFMKEYFEEYVSYLTRTCGSNYKEFQKGRKPPRTVNNSNGGNENDGAVDALKPVVDKKVCHRGPCSTEAHACKRCGKQFPELYLLKKHLHRKHACKPALSNVASEDLLMELQNERNNTASFFCTKCNTGFKSRSGLHYHNLKCSDPNERGEIESNENEAFHNEIAFLKERIGRLEQAI
jgi:hypothetical protein